MRSAQDIERAQRAACVAGGVAAVSQLLLPLWHVYLSGATLWTGAHIMSALVLLGLTYGVLRTSRMSSVALVLFFMLTQLYQWRAIESVPGVLTLVGGLLAIVLLFFMVRGVQATFAFHHMERRFDSWQRTMDSTLDPRLFEDE